jgi:nickel-dependent lactate racemase
MSQEHLIGKGQVDSSLSRDQVRDVLVQAFDAHDLSGQRVLVIIPDGTRTAPIPLLFQLLNQILRPRVAKLDYLIALGTHPPMNDLAIDRLIGLTSEQRAAEYPDVNIYNHRWDREDTFVTLGTISSEKTEALSSGMLSLDVPININRMALAYDRLLICGPVFPHEVVGFSGGNKYFFPGIGGPEVIDFTHWLGALITSYEIIGTKDTPVREAINQAAAMIPTEKLACCMVVQDGDLAGLYVGSPEQAWSAAADLSAQIHVKYVDHPYERVLSVMPEMYDDIWTAAKGMYKLEPVIADGGEVIVYAPHIDEISYTHGDLIREVGYHVRDYFLAQWAQFKDIPWGVLAHSTHLRGIGTYENGVEKPRIQVTLTTQIPPGVCEMVNLGYRDPDSIDPSRWANREDEGILLVPHAGEVLYRLKDEQPSFPRGVR